MSLYSRCARDVDASHNEGPVHDFAHYHRQRLNQNHRASSLESSTRKGLLSPPHRNPAKENRTPSPESMKESYSLDNVNIPPLISPFKAARFNSSPSSSEPTLAVDEAPKVNFSPSARFKDEEKTETELNPMLDPFSGQDDSDFDDEAADTGSAAKKASAMRSFLQSLIPRGRRERLNSEKSTINGLQKESHV